MTEEESSSDRAHRALRRASLRENTSSGHFCDKQQRQQGIIRNNDPTQHNNNENPPPPKAVARSRFAVQPPPPPPPMATTSNNSVAANDFSTNDRKRSSSSSTAAAAAASVASIATSTRSKKQRSSSGPPPPLPPSALTAAQAQQASQQGDDDLDNDDAASAETVVAYGPKSVAAAAAAKATATVTPAVPRRQNLFGNDETTTNTKKEHQQQQQLAAVPEAAKTSNNNTATTTTLLPDGVVDIYPTTARVCGGANKLCNCVADISLHQRAGFLHTAQYGADWQAYLREKENREYPIIMATSLPCAESPFSITHTHTQQGSGRSSSSSMQQQYDSPDPSTTSKQQSSSSSSSLAASSLSSSSASSTASTPSPSTTTPASSSAGGLLLRFDIRAKKDAPRFLEENTGHLKAQPYINATMRAVLVSWLVEIGTDYDISDHAHHLAITLLDSMIAKGPTDVQAWEESCRRRRLRSVYHYHENNGDDDSSDNYNNSGDSSTNSTEPDYFVIHPNAFQALGCACVWIASKMEDRNPPLQDDFVYISDQACSTGMLRHFERRICKELSFNLHRLTPIHYANTFLRASNACPCLTCPFDHPVLRQLFLYLLELARIPIALVDCPPSLVAAAAVYLGRATLGLREEDPGRQAAAANTSTTTTSASANSNTNNCCFWTKTLQHYTGYSVDDLKDTVLRIYQYQLHAEQFALAPYIKFRSRSRLQVSLKNALRIEELGFDLGLNHNTLPLATK